MGTEALAPSVPGELTGRGLQLPDDLSEAEWLEAGRVLARIGDAYQWWIGDWINYGERKWGEIYEDAERVTRFSNGTLRDFAWIARTYELSWRQDNLSFEHHKAAAVIEDVSQRKNWLERALVRHWGYDRLRQEIKGTYDRLDRVHAKKAQKITCPECGSKFELGEAA